MEKYSKLRFRGMFCAGFCIKKLLRLQADKDRFGMTYKEVADVIGGYGELSVTSSAGGTVTSIYKWSGNGGIGSNAQVIFQDGAMQSKAQYGLE